VAGGRGGQWRARREREAVEAKKDSDLVRMQQPLEIGGDVVMGESGDGVGGDTEETRVGVKCSRCAKKGHNTAACTAEIYCVICDAHNDHVNHRCPVLKLPRPVAHAVGYAVHGLGFYHIPRPPLSRAKKDSRMALISVEGGQVPMEEVRRHLERLFLGRWTWELMVHEENSYLVKFPSKVELQRSVAFGGADIKGDKVPTGARMKFELWKEKEAGFLLPKVWVRVYGLRKELYEFQELWAVGSMLGSTQIVDMETTRKSEYGRILVAVLNPSLIPEQMDVVIGDHYFELNFEVEKLGFDEKGEEAEVEWHKEVMEAGWEGSLSDGQVGEEEKLERESKKLKRDVDGSRGQGIDKDAQIGEEGFLTWKEQVQGMTKEEFEAFLRAKAGEILNQAADRVFEEVADRVLGEDDEKQQKKEMEGGGKAAGGDKEMELEVRIREAAMVSDASKMQVRASPRLQGSKDEHILTKAEGRVARKNLEFKEGDV
jgi:hypothetical protein